MLQKLNYIIFTMLISTLLLSGCGKAFDGKIYFMSNRFKGSNFWEKSGTCVFENGKVKKMYPKLKTPAVTRDGQLMIGALTEGNNEIIDLHDNVKDTISFKYSAGEFVWFSNKEKIAYESLLKVSQTKLVNNIVIVDIETKKEKQITSNKVVGNLIYDIKISPDDKKILYSISNASPEQKARRNIRLYDLSTNEERMLPFSSGTFDWSPDGKIIVLYGIYDDGETVEYGQQIVFYNIKTGEYHKLEASKDYISLNYLTYSPDGKKIAYVRNERNGRKTLWVMDSDGTNHKKLLDDGYTISDLSWTK